MIKPSYKECYVPDAPGSHQLRKLAYTEWGDKSLFPVVCVHGLTRNSHDFDFLAPILAKNFRVICLDVMGRGRSDYARDGSCYDYNQYISDLKNFFSLLKIKECHFIGTSMGGIMGMIYATLHRRSIKKLILNDIGPYATKEALARIGKYVSNYHNFATFESAMHYLKDIFHNFGIIDEAKWIYFTKHSIIENNDGTFRLNYDPAIGDIFHKLDMYKTDMNLWGVWGLIKKSLPILLLKGELSDILSDMTVQQMRLTHPVFEVVTIKGVGHAPSLMYEDQISVINNWLLEG